MCSILYFKYIYHHHHISNSLKGYEIVILLFPREGERDTIYDHILTALKLVQFNAISVQDMVYIHSISKYHCCVFSLYPCNIGVIQKSKPKFCLWQKCAHTHPFLSALILMISSINTLVSLLYCQLQCTRYRL